MKDMNLFDRIELETYDDSDEEEVIDVDVVELIVDDDNPNFDRFEY
jgi:hypothetical protein